MTRPPAPPLTPAEQATVARFEAAPVLAEAWRPTWVGTVLESCVRDVALGRIAAHSDVTAEMVADWHTLNPGHERRNLWCSRCGDMTDHFTSDHGADSAVTVEEVERVARAMWDAVKDDSEWHHLGPSSRDRWRTAARAALAARRPATEAEQAVERVLAVLDALDQTSTEAEVDGDRAIIDARVVSRTIRAALGGAARDGSDG